MRELLGEDLAVRIRGDVAVLHSPAVDGVDDPPDHLADARFPLGGAEWAPEVLLGHDVRGVLRPGPGELHAALLEGVSALLVVGDDGVADLPVHLVEGVDPFPGEVAPERKPLTLHSKILLLGRHDPLLLDSAWGKGHPAPLWGNAVENDSRVILPPTASRVKCSGHSIFPHFGASGRDRAVQPQDVVVAEVRWACALRAHVSGAAARVHVRSR